MMHIDPKDSKDEINFDVLFNETMDVLRMDYRGGDISMLFMLPGGVGSQRYLVEKPIDIERLGEMMDADFIKKTNSIIAESEVSVTMPKFSFETDHYMNDPLKDLGMGIAFEEGNANFSGMKEPSPHINAVLHKAFICVDETGTEAAAATAVQMLDGSELMNINLNHPFIFAIQDNETGLILFMGRVMDPTK
jgi:serpin B